jgi:hypothetical protein
MLGGIAAMPAVATACASSWNEAHSTSILSASRFFLAIAASSLLKLPSPFGCRR